MSTGGPTVPAHRHHRVAALALGAVLAVGACSSDDGDESSTAAEQPSNGGATEQGGIVAKADGRTLVDVRTPAEYADGHLEDALNIDVQDPAFDARIAELPTDGSYLVYCRSGNRSAAAVARMSELGFTDVVDGGAFDALAAAGLPTA